MPNQDYQRHSFLGGEISPSLYERADMEKFGKWFSKAENIRFRETGAFRNRCGFVKVADTKYNQSGQIIKLLSFEFNDEEAFLIELGPSYARFFRNGNPIMSSTSIYELETPFSDFQEVDIKYAQAGDTIFITHPNYGIYELVRLQADGSNWEFKPFSTNILPMKEENEDKNKTVSIANFSQDVKTISLNNPNTSTYLNVSFTFGSDVIYTASSVVLSELYNGIATAVGSDYVTSLSGTTMTIAPASSVGTIPDFSITFSTSYDTQQVATQTVEAKTDSRNSTASSTATISYLNWPSVDSIYIKVTAGKTSSSSGGDTTSLGTIFEQTREVTLSNIGQAAGFGSLDFSSGHISSSGLEVDTWNMSLSYPIVAKRGTNYFGASATITLTRNYSTTSSYTYNSVTSSTSSDYYLMTASDSTILKNLAVNESILVKHSVDAQELKNSYNAAGTYTLGPVKSDGNWRFYTLGNWVGNITIQYSTDNQQTWVDYYKWASQDSNDTPANINTSGSLVADDLVWFRVVSTVSSTGTKPLQVFFATSSFSVNSYYKVIFRSSDTQSVVECIKNDVGLFSNETEWRLPAFSSYEGWPQTIAFYQNRLFFGKDYIIYGSRSNDFWDFYEPIKLQADDPLTMSLLSTNVNNIKNLVTQRSFFTFTGGGEFGVGSEGALTQSDKYLKPFSSNGSAQCSPILISDVILFVDKSYNTVRALKYSLESDGYEAPDITITLKSLLDNEKIISTDIIYEEKEALFLSDTGIIWVLKYITDQNVLSWSHWQHAFGKITNIAVVPNGPKHDLYIAVEANGHKWIEKMDQSEFMDTVEVFAATEDEKVSVTGTPGNKKVVLQGDRRYFKTIDENGQIECPEDTTAGFRVGSSYISTATLLSPVTQASDYAHHTYETKNPFKVFFYYLNSHGFKVGVEEDEKMGIEWQPVPSDIDDENDLTSGKKSVLIPSRFDGSARVSFVQEEPYPMEVADVLIQTDYGGK